MVCLMNVVSSAAARILRLPPPTTPGVDVERGIRIPAGTGVELLTDLYLPRPRGPRPTVLIRTPYGRERPWALFARGFAERGYQAVIQSCRGTFGSSGEITFSAEASDGRATADWIVTQPWSNGDVGTWGPSYLSFVQWALASTRPPQLKAMAIQIMSADRSRVYYPGGAFALDNAVTWMAGMAIQGRSLRERLRAQSQSRPVLETAFQQLPLRDLDVLVTGHEVPYYRAWLAHQPGDEFWRPLDFTPLLADHRVPTSFVGGWYDYCLPYQLEEFRVLAEAGADTQLVVGPWAHSAPAGLLAGFREGLAWLDVHLRGRGARPATRRVRIEVKWHARGSSICPSTSPSRPSHSASAAACSAGSLAGVRIELPWASALIVATQTWNSPFSGPQTLAGAPATMPSKSAGNRCASISASRPPSEQPLKYERCGAMP
jgi:predicted acyl esterase